MKTNKIAAILSLIGLTTTALAAQTGSITIQGTIPTSTSVTVTGSGNYNTLDLTTSQTNLQVASVQEQSNDVAGYKVTLTSANSGTFKNGSLGSVSYTAQYNSQTVTLSTTPFTVTSTTSATAIVNVTKPFTISYTGQAASGLMSGTYSDTLTFTISAN